MESKSQYKRVTTQSGVEYIASAPPAMLVSGTESATKDACIEKLMDIEGRSWEWLRDHGFTVDRYEVKRHA